MTSQHDAAPHGAQNNAEPAYETTTGSGVAGDTVNRPEGHTEAVSSSSSQAGPQNEAPVAAEKAANEEKPGYIGGRSKGKIALIMFALCLAVFLGALDVTIITTAIPTITEHFHTASGYTWIGSAFLLACSASVPSWGKISDIFGRKPMLLGANIVFMVGSLVSALADSIGMLIAGRAVQGLGAGGLIILVNIVIADIFPLRVRGGFYAIIGAVWAIASAIGPIIGGSFTQDVSWRWCFYVNLPLDGIAFIILLFFLDIKIPRTPLWDGLKAIDWTGSILVVAGTLMLLLGLQDGGVVAPWASAKVVCLIVFGIVSWVLFGLWEWKYAKYPIIPVEIVGKLTNVAALSCVFWHGAVFIAESYYLPLYFQAVRGADPIHSGVLLLATALAVSVGSLGSGLFIAKTGMFLPPMYVGFTLLTVGTGLFVNFGANSSLVKVVLYQVVAGIGIGPMFQAPLIAIQAHINPRNIATATALIGFVRQIASSVSVVVGEVVFQNQMAKKADSLVASLGPQLARELAGGNAGANTRLIDSLPPAQRSVVRTAFADSLQPMWIMYTALSAAGFVSMFFIQRKKLTNDHVETVTGLEAERANAEARAADRAADRAAKHESKQNRTPKSPVTGPGGLSDKDLEAGHRGPADKEIE